MKIRTATIGTNFIVDSFIKGARMDERFDYAAVYSRNQETASAFASKYGARRTFTSLQELAESPDIDAVYIASPNICHPSHAIMMMDHGKHVICEKPMAPSPSEAISMIEASRRNGVALIEAMKTTLLPNFRNVKEALGRIGRVRCYNSSFCQYSSRFAAFLQGGPVANVFNPAMKGGSLRDLGVYCIAPMVHLFGVPWDGEYTMEKMLDCVSVTPMMMLPGGCSDPSCAIDVQGSMVVSYPGMQATITWSKACDGAWGTQILGEDGTIEITKTSTMIAPRVRLRTGVGDAGLRKGTDEWEDLSTPTPDFMYPEVKEFFDLIESGKTESAINTHQRSLDTARIVDSLYRVG